MKGAGAGAVADAPGGRQRTSFGPLLRRHRAAAGMTQEELAERSGLSVQAISALERGVRQAPRGSTIRLLAGALGLGPEERAELVAAARQPAHYGGEPVAGDEPWPEPAPAGAGQEAAGGELEGAADELAEQVSQQWTCAAVERRLLNPLPIPVRWRLSRLPVAGPVADAVGDAESPRFPPLPGLPAITPGALAAGGPRDLLGVYGGLDSGRLIVLGEPGAGKTAAAIRLVLAALQHRGALPARERSRVPVPVLLTARGWDPANGPLTSWLAARLAAEYPGLRRRRRRGPDLVHELILSGRVAVLLDGLDELSPPLRSTALRALDEQATFRVVVLIRSQELVAAAAREHLPGAVALELQPVEPGDAADYLGRCRPRPLPAAWDRLLDEVRDHPGGAVARALRTPLALTLVRDTYGAGDPVDELLDRDRFDCPDALTDHLLDRVLIAAYGPRPGRRPRYSLAKAQRWLGFIAHRMSLEPTAGDLAWWLVPRWAPAWPRRLFTVLAVVLAGSAAGLLTGAPAGALAVSGPVGLAAALALPCRSRPPRQVGRPRWGSALSRANLAFGLVAGLAAGLAFGVAAGLSVGLAAGLAVGLTVALVVGLAVGLLFGLVDGLGQPAAGPISPIDPITCWRRDRHYGAGLLAAFAIAGTVTGGLAWILTGWLSESTAGAIGAGLLGGLAGGVALGLTRAFAARSALLGRVASGLGGTIVFGLILGLAAGAAAALANGLASGLMLGLAYGLGFGLAIAAADSAAWPAALAFAQLRRRGRTPLRLLRFLEDARSRHVLRVAGPVYQFRHARLQERLAGAYARERSGSDRAHDPPNG